MSLTSREHINKFYFYSFIAVLIFLPWSVRLTSYAFVLMLAMGLLSTSVSVKFQRLRKNPSILVFIFFYLLYVVGLSYAPDFNEGMDGLEQKLALLLVPLLMVSSMPFTDNQRKSAMLLFVCSTVLLTFACIVLNIVHLSTGPHPQVNFDFHTLARFRQLHRDANPLWMEFSYVGFSRYFIPPTYLSIYLTFCFLILAYHEPISEKAKTIKLITLAWIVIVVVLLSARIGLILFVGINSLNLLRYLLKKKFPLRESLESAGFIASVCLLILLFPVTRFRVIEEPLATPLEVPTDYKEWNSINLRVLEWESGIKGIKEHGIKGTGTGGTLDALETYYDEAQLGDLGKRYNSHNQYIETYLEIGLLGFLTLIGCFIVPFRAAVKSKNWLLLSLVIMAATACLTTCLFEKAKGLMFFVTFVSLFMFTKEDHHETVN